MSPCERILLASTNAAKRRKLAWVVSASGLPTRPLDPDDGRPPDETGESFLANARLKALVWSRRVTDLVVASDGGMTIPALGAAWNELRTGRAAGAGATDRERAAHLLALARDLRGEERRVSWTEALAVACGGVELAAWERSLTSARLVEELDQPRIQPGFWADSLCRLDDGRLISEIPNDRREELDLNWSALKRAFETWWSDRSRQRQHGL